MMGIVFADEDRQGTRVHNEIKYATNIGQNIT